MAFDIYGGHLRPGYCEVHPDVPEPYPCYECVHNAQPSPSYPEPQPPDIGDLINEAIAANNKRWVEKIEDMVLFCDNPNCNHSNCIK